MATTTFDNLITFSRGSNATVTGPNGLIQWAPANLLTNSQDFEAAAWVKGANATVSSNQATAPDGTLTADKVTFTADVAAAEITQTATVASGANYTASIYIWSDTGEASTVTVQMQSGTGAALASLTNVAISTTPTRLTLSGTTTDTSAKLRITRGTGMGGKTLYVWGAQLELGSTATSYNNTSVRNLLGFSEAFDDGSWPKTRCSIVTGAQANPVNGLFNAQKLMEDTTNNNHWMRRSGPAGTYMFSVYAKAAGRSFIQLTGLIANTDFVTFNLATGTVDSAGSAVSNISITPVGDGWYRVAAYIPVNATGATIGLVSTAGAGWLPAYQGDGNSGVYIYGAMLSNSASLDPYVPTPGAAPSSTAYYGPRFDYDPVTLLPRGLLIEEQRVNSLTYSADFTNAAWTKSSCTVTANQGTAPDGTNTLTLLQFSAQFGRLQQGSLTSGTVYTFSIWCRVASGTRVYSLYDALGNPLGSFTATTTLTRYSVTFTAPATSTLYAVQDRNAGPFVDTFIWGAQLEAGAFATSYIPTIASTVTRSADVATITGSLFSQWYNQSEGAWIASFSPYVVNFGVVTQISAATNNDRFQLLNDNSGQIAVSTGGVGQGTIDAGTVSAGLTNNLSYAYRTNDTAASLNGGASVADTTVTLPVVDRLCVGATVAPAGFLCGHIRSIRYVPVRAADFQLQQVTT
jgi:hypothetical protein